jgi:hypothetical protein
MRIWPLLAAKPWTRPGCSPRPPSCSMSPASRWMPPDAQRPRWSRGAHTADRSARADRWARSGSVCRLRQTISLLTDRRDPPAPADRRVPHDSSGSGDERAPARPALLGAPHDRLVPPQQHRRGQFTVHLRDSCHSEDCFGMHADSSWGAPGLGSGDDQHARDGGFRGPSSKVTGGERFGRIPGKVLGRSMREPGSHEHPRR